MSKATYDSTIPVSGASFSSFNMRNNYQSLAQGDSNPLRPRAQASPNMTVAVAGTQVESYFHQVYSDYTEPFEFASQNSPTVVAPISNSRIDILVASGVSASGTLNWIIGTEGATPTLPSIPEEQLPICAVYCKTTMDRILNYEEKDTDATEGYLYKDLRPKIVRQRSEGAFRSGDMMLSSNTSAPGGWSDVSATYNNKFIRLSSGTPLDTSGADTHTHDAGTYAGPSHTHADGSYIVTNDCGVGYSLGGGCYGFANSGAYNVTGTSAAGGTGGITGASASGDNVPAYVQLRIFKKD